ncbi:Gfo/Idh/MocA family oxidoreductase [Aliiglaciecola sp. 2_MG-2023]|uniref:Gfo/Idh/MocA family protein n=1 Tax=unclassified Aliiglaciecola TaxID=2593648 RepID=UPI0026E38BBD|nr:MULTISPECIES: Gfo/Idh/MocA family oxidoreductase [unclassified Aliiglaciecola]MDO6709371.1 Gfo/Idh/MocA family oxidoreductase [Aliiglaciecola sp. 2_MG-2023]MDO6750519.1 Gfo/Idh/MocA family oxidoreductase [Aliiglaciecola sp. 1_MG-2023]
MKFLICGMGSIGVRHFQNLKHLGFNDISLYSTGNSNYPKIEELTKDIPRYNNLNQALAQNPDVCMITNPTSMHVETAIEAANKGCHLYIEKPLSHNLTNLAELNKIINQKNLITFVTYQFRFHPHIQLLKDLLHNENQYGDAVWAQAEWSEYLPDWHPWEDYKQSYSAKKELGGGVLRTQIHPLNYLEYLFGDIEHLTATTQSTGILDIDVDDIADIQISFKSKINATVHVDYIQKPRVHKLKIVTNKGRFHWNCHLNSLKFINLENKITEFTNENFERNDMFVKMLEEYIDCVNNKTPTSFSIEQASKELSLLLGE